MYNYSTFEEDAKKREIKGRVLTVLEFDKIRDKLKGFVKTPYGMRLAESLNPTTDFAKVNESLGETYEAFTYVSRYGSLPIGTFPLIEDTLRYIKAGGVADMRALLDIAAFLRSARELKGMASDEKKELAGSSLFEAAGSLETEDNLYAEITNSIISENEMSDRASPKLYDIRRDKKDVERSIRVILDRIIRNSEEILQEQIITIRDGRYCVPVKSEARSKLPGIIHDTSSTGQTVFIEPMGVVDANNKIRELSALEDAEIERILKSLTSQVLKSETALMTDISIVAGIDFNSAKAELAYYMDAVKPALNSEGHIRLVRARHPLIDKERVVPIDIENGFDYMTLIITGPNTGGKTVSLKTCGLMTLMTMAGLMIPCSSGTEIAVFDRVLADIGDEQSIEQSLSTFSAHISNIVFILKNIRGRSLVLLDELGSGTDPAEGAALAVAVLGSLRGKDCVTMATTHYRELKEYAVTTEGVMNASCEFDTETLSPTYRLITGTSGTSNAFVIAGKLGMPGRIIDDAKSRMTDEDLKLGHLLAEAENDRKHAQKLEEENEKLNLELKNKLSELESERASLKASKTRILNDSRRQQKELYEDKLEEIDELIKTAREKQKKNNDDDAREELDKIRRRLRAGVKDLSGDGEDDNVLKNVKLPGEAPSKAVAGQKYFIPHMGVTGTALDSTDKKNGKVRVRSGSMTYQVLLSQLRMPTADQLAKENAPVKASLKPQSAGSVSTIKVTKATTVMPEIMLLGKTVAEAQTALDKYIDDCALAGIKTIRIVHGKGTGALRSAVSEELTINPRIEEFRLGGQGEGGDGVTIAKLY